MKCLVTGGTGFTGKALCKRLLDDGHDLTSMDYKEGLKTEELRSWGADVMIGSVMDREVLSRCMQGCEVVFHLAAAFRELDVSNDYYRRINAGGTANVADLALKYGVRKLVYCSTCGVHGNIDDPPGGEDAPIQPADYYQQTKYEGEKEVARRADRGLKYTILRPAAIYGPGDPERFVMIFRGVARGRFPMFGNGKTYYHPLYIDNLVDAFILASESGKGDGEAYLIADEEYVEIEDLVRRVARALDVEIRIPHYPVMPLVIAGHVCEKLCRPFHITPPIFPRRVDWFRQNRAFKIDKAKRDLGYLPHVGLDEGLRRTAEWYLGEGYIEMPAKGP